MTTENLDFAKILATLSMNGIMATFGAVANYLYAYAHKGVPMRFMNFFITAFLGFFVGNLVGSFLPQDFAYRDGTLLVAGFTCYPILAMLEKKFPEILSRRIDSVLNPGGQPTEDESKKK